MAYPRIPGEKTRVEYYVDVAHKQAGYKVRTAANPTAARLGVGTAAQAAHRKRPQAIDAQAERLRKLLTATATVAVAQ